MISPKKSLSQNFLNDKNISKKIVNQLNIKNKTILEIGPGYGFLTDDIIIKGPKLLYLIEKDTNLIKILKQKYKSNKKIIIIEDDILNFNLKKFKNLIVISNLPYNLSTKIILYLFNFNKNISEMVLMLQKEVAIKFDYNLKKMNKYKFITRVLSDYSRCFDVSKNVFIPVPKIKSTVVKFNFNRKEVDLIKVNKFSNLIFKNVRKKISNNINININKNKFLLDKRINQLSIKELLVIYNFF